MKTQLFTFLSFVLSFAVLGEVKVQKAPLKSLLIDNASVVTDVTGTDAAKRLEAEGGRSWIDGDGRVYRVERRASFRGLSAFSADDPDSTVQWSFDYPGAEYCDLSYDPPSRWYLSYGRMEDVENDGVIWQEEVQYVYEGTAPWSASSVMMKREHYNDEFVLSLAFVTNAADRLATTGEVARIASSLTGGLTTNDVCSIVTNEVVVVSEWSAWSYTYLNFIEPNYDPYIDVQSLEWVESGDVEDCAFPCWRGVFTGKGWNGGYFTSVAYSGYELGRGGRDSEEVILYTGAICDEGFKARRVKIEERANALGLAMAKDVEKKFAEATNTIPSIVTNQVVGGWNEWVHDPRVARVSSFFCAEQTSDYSYWVLEFYEENERCVIIQGYGDAPKKEDVSEIRWTDGPSEYTSAKSVRQRQPSRNALGLAMAKDLEKLPDHKTVTNVARAVSNSFWDEKNEVLWRLEFRDGEPMFVPVTNENVKATGGVL